MLHTERRLAVGIVMAAFVTALVPVTAGQGDGISIDSFVIRDSDGSIVPEGAPLVTTHTYVVEADYRITQTLTEKLLFSTDCDPAPRAAGESPVFWTDRQSSPGPEQPWSETSRSVRFPYSEGAVKLRLHCHLPETLTKTTGGDGDLHRAREGFGLIAVKAQGTGAAIRGATRAVTVTDSTLLLYEKERADAQAGSAGLTGDLKEKADRLLDIAAGMAREGRADAAILTVQSVPTQDDVPAGVVDRTLTWILALVAAGALAVLFLALWRRSQGQARALRARLDEARIELDSLVQVASRIDKQKAESARDRVYATLGYQQEEIA